MIRLLPAVFFISILFSIAPFASARLPIEKGSSSEERYGTHIDPDGWVHFGVYSPAARQVNLLLFDSVNATSPTRVIPMERHGEDWRIKIRGPGIGPGLLFMYQAEGPREVSVDDQFGLLFNEHYYLNDPYAYKTQNVRYSGFFSATPYTNLTHGIYRGGGKSVVYDHLLDRFPGHVSVKPEDLILQAMLHCAGSW